MVEGGIVPLDLHGVSSKSFRLFALPVQFVFAICFLCPERISINININTTLAQYIVFAGTGYLISEETTRSPEHPRLSLCERHLRGRGCRSFACSKF